MVSFDVPFLIETVQKRNALLIHFEHPILTHGEAYLCFFQIPSRPAAFLENKLITMKKTLKGENVDTTWFFMEKPTWYIWIVGII